LKSEKTYNYTILIHPEEDGETGFWVEVPALPGCFTQGDTVEQCIERAREAIEGYLESLAKLGEPIPEEPDRENAVISKVRVKLRVSA
jgi:predicted RNase H-like HicB family nuclease